VTKVLITPGAAAVVAAVVVCPPAAVAVTVTTVVTVDPTPPTMVVAVAVTVPELMVDDCGVGVELEVWTLVEANEALEDTWTAVVVRTAPYD
jgi:hypothetical protein